MSISMRVHSEEFLTEFFAMLTFGNLFTQGQKCFHSDTDPAAGAAATSAAAFVFGTKFAEVKAAAEAEAASTAAGISRICVCIEIF